MTTTTWTGGSGSWMTPTNWSGGIPGPLDSALFPGGAYTVTLAASTAIASLSGGGTGTLFDVNSGTLTLSQGGSWFGTLDVAAGATLDIASGVFDLTKYAFFDYLASGTIAGAIAGDGTIVMGDTSSPAQQFTLAAGATLDVGAFDLKPFGTLTIDGDLSYGGVLAAPYVALNGYTNGVVIATGHTVTLSGSGMLGETLVGGTFVIAGDYQSGALTVGDYAVAPTGATTEIQVTGVLYEENRNAFDDSAAPGDSFTLSIEAAGTFAALTPVDGAGGDNIGQGSLAAVVNAGQLDVNFTTLNVSAPFTSSCTVSVTAGSLVLNGGGTLGGVVDGSAGGGVEIAAGTVLLGRAVVLDEPVLQVDAGATLGSALSGNLVTYAGTLINQGTIDLGSMTLQFQGFGTLAGTLTGGGTIIATGSILAAPNLSGNHTKLLIDGTMVEQGGMTLGVNTGDVTSLDIGGSGTLIAEGTIMGGVNDTFDNAGHVVFDGTNGGTYVDSGTIINAGTIGFLSDIQNVFTGNDFINDGLIFVGDNYTGLLASITADPGGAGTIELGAGATLDLGAVAASQTIEFTGANETLCVPDVIAGLAEPNAMAATIVGFGAGDSIQYSTFDGGLPGYLGTPDQQWPIWNNPPSTPLVSYTENWSYAGGVLAGTLTSIENGISQTATLAVLNLPGLNASLIDINQNGITYGQPYPSFYAANQLVGSNVWASGSGSGSWTGAANWAGGTLPNADTDVLLPAYGSPYIVTLSTSATVDALNARYGGGTLDIDGGSLVIQEPLTFQSTTAPFTIYGLDAPLIVNTGTLDAINGLNINDGLTLGAAGTLIVSSGSLGPDYTNSYVPPLTPISDIIDGTIEGSGTWAFQGQDTVAVGAAAVLDVGAVKMYGTMQLGGALSYAGNFDFGGGVLNTGGYDFSLTGSNNVAGYVSGGTQLPLLTGGGTLTIAGAASVLGLRLTGNGTALSVTGTMSLGNNAVDLGGNATDSTSLSIGATGTLLLAGSAPEITNSGYSTTPGANDTVSNAGLIAIPVGSATGSQPDLATDYAGISAAAFANTGTIAIQSAALWVNTNNTTLNGTVEGSGALWLEGAATLEAGLVLSVGTLAFNPLPTAPASNTTVVLAANQAYGGFVAAIPGQPSPSYTLDTAGFVFTLHGTGNLAGAIVSGGGTLADTGSFESALRSPSGPIGALTVTGGTTIDVGENGVQLGGPGDVGNVRGVLEQTGQVLLGTTSADTATLSIGSLGIYAFLTNDAPPGATGTVPDALKTQGTAVIDNDGLMIKSDSGGVSLIQNNGTLVFNNAGTILATLGTLAIAAPLNNNGTIQASGLGAITISGAITGSGTIINDPATVSLDGAVGAGQTVDFTGPGGVLALGNPTQFAGTIGAYTAGNVIDLPTIGPGAIADEGFVGNTLTLHGSFGTIDLAFATAPATPVTFGADGGTGTDIGIACFVAGTRIATRHGAVPVEQLRIGDRVRTVLGKDLAPIVWIGQRDVACDRHPNPRQVWPVRVAAGAFGRGRPSRDLFLSPDHAVFARGVLIPIKYLINDLTIAQVQARKVTYYHIELPRHDVLLAEGLPTESYLDTGDRSNFANGGAFTLYPDFSSLKWDAEGCAPLTVTGPSLDAVRVHINALAAAVMKRRGAGAARAGLRRPGRMASPSACY